MAIGSITFGAWLRPAPMPVTPQVRTPPRPMRLKGSPNTSSILFFSELQISSRHRLRTAILVRNVSEAIKKIDRAAHWTQRRKIPL